MTHAAAWFAELQPHIEQVARAICRRHATDETDADDFVQNALLHLHLRSPAGSGRRDGIGRPDAYIGSVVANLFEDERRRERGRFRPSEAAARLGRTAIRLERLLFWGYSHREAIGTLASRDDVPENERELERLLGKLSARRSRQWLGEEALQVLASPFDPVAAVIDRECRAVLRAALTALPDEDLLVLRMRYVDGFTVRKIAALLHLDAKRLYTRLARLKQRLKTRLGDLGIDSA